MKNGTRLFGLVLRETPDSLAISDFNAGTLLLGRTEIEAEYYSFSGEVLIEALNGTTYSGEIVQASGYAVLLRSDVLGLISIPANMIAGITPSGAYFTRRGQAWFVNPNSTRYFFAPSAIPLRRKEGYYQNAYLLANSVSVGLTDNITLGAGVVIPLLFYVTPKLSFKLSPNFYAAAGLLYTQSFISGLNLGAGIAYGITSLGNSEHNLSLGAGYGFARFNNEYSSTPMPILMLGGMTRLGKKLSLVSENWLIPRAGYQKEITTADDFGRPVVETIYEEGSFYSGALSLGLRFMPGIRTSVDFSIVGLRTNPGQPALALPYLDFVYKFN